MGSDSSNESECIKCAREWKKSVKAQTLRALTMKSRHVKLPSQFKIVIVDTFPIKILPAIVEYTLRMEMFSEIFHKIHIALALVENKII